MMLGLVQFALATLALASSAAASSAPVPGSAWVQRSAAPATSGALKPVEAALLARGGDILPPPALYANAVEIGAKKGAGAPVDTFLLGIISGCHIAFGGLLAVTIGGSLPAMKTANPGLQKLLFGLFGLPFGLYMVLTSGGELFTGNTAFLTAAVIEGRATVQGLLKNWTLSYVGNLMGSLLLAKLVTAAGLNSAPTAAAAITVGKVAGPFFQTFLKGIVCNWMVCMAVWIATGASSLTEKYLAMVLPVSAFVAFGAEHSVANMFLLPLGLFSGASSTVSWSDVFLKNILPVTLGNIVGGAVCQTGLYSTVYGSLLK
eukprot:jgi/Undpi1/1523/HiC_scaffold_11.g04913.m1